MTLDRDRVAAAWGAADLAVAILPADRAIVGDSASLRALILDLADLGVAADELLSACAMLGRFIAHHGGSPTLAALTMDHACDAMSDAGSDGSPWRASGRAAVVEGFVSELVETCGREARRAWEFPGCVVRIGEQAVAIAASPPADDDEEVEGWASRVAKACALEGARRAFVSGPERTRSRVVDALRLVGIDIIA